MFQRLAIKIAFAVFAIFAAARPLHAGKKIYVGAEVPATNQVSMDRIEHQAWDVILRRYVDKDGLVNYAALKASATDVKTLQAYLRSLSTATTTIPAKRESRLAYWINAYNAVTVHGILKEYPTKSIRNHTAKLAGYNIWHDLQLVVGGKPYSLDQMEHKILRNMGDPRIHFAIVCASTSCPRLLNEAYVPDRLVTQLDVNTKDFFARSQNFRYDAAHRRFYMSAILRWFEADFGSNQAAQLRTIANWLPTADAQQAAKRNAVNVKWLEYDWSLNEQFKVATASGR